MTLLCINFLLDETEEEAKSICYIIINIGSALCDDARDQTNGRLDT